MIETEEPVNYRAEIALRHRRRAAESRKRKWTMAVFALMAYSAFGNFVAGAIGLRASPLDAVIGITLGILYALGVYRVWFKDDLRWWPVAVPAGISIALLVLAWLGGPPRLVPLLVNIALLVLVPFRKRAAAAVPESQSHE